MAAFESQDDKLSLRSGFLCLFPCLAVRPRARGKGLAHKRLQDALHCDLRQEQGPFGVSLMINNPSVLIWIPVDQGFIISA